MPNATHPLGDMDPEDFRQNAQRVFDWIGDYLDGRGDRPVFPEVAPGSIRAQLPPGPPRGPEPMEQILDDFQRVILPGLTHWNHRRFFGYFPVSPSGPAVLGEALAAALGTNAMLWRASPAATELEQVATDWLRQMLGLPEVYRGMLTDSASTATMTAIAAAREAVPGLDAREEGLAGRPASPRLILYTSDQAHSSVEKAAIILGIGRKNVRKIRTDKVFRMDPESLERAIREDLAAGRLPFCVVATAGTTSTASIDPLEAIADVCARHRLWFHVDGAYGGMAAIMPEFREPLRGIGLADSLVTNPHKWLFNPIGCSALFVRDPEALRRAFSLVPDYLRTRDAGVTNFMEWGPHLSRRFRALELWMVIRHFGQAGLIARLREHVRLAGVFAAEVHGSPDFELMAPVSLGTASFRAHPQGYDDEAYLDYLNEALINEVNRGGEAFLSHTELGGRFTLRMAIGNIRTEERDVLRTWDVLGEAMRHLLLVHSGKAPAPAATTDFNRAADNNRPPANILDRRPVETPAA